MTAQVTPQDTNNPTAKRIAFIGAQWHADIVDRAKAGFFDELQSAGIGPDRVDVLSVPGAYEIPLLAKKLAQTGRYDGIVCAALVVDGGIYRHDFVAEAVVSGMMRVQLDTDIPVFSVVLSPHNFQETEVLIDFFREHFVLKGAEAARAYLCTRENLATVAA